MTINEKVTIGGILGIVGGIALHVISDMYFTRSKYGMILLILGFCAVGAGAFLKDQNL